MIEPKATKKRPAASIIRRDEFAAIPAPDGEAPTEDPPCPIILDADKQVKPAPFLPQPVKFARTVVHPRLTSGPRPLAATSAVHPPIVSLPSSQSTSIASEGARSLLTMSVVPKDVETL